MKLNKNVKLRNVGGQYMVVANSEDQVGLTNVITMNNVSAHIWEYIGDKEISEKELVDWVCEEYEVDEMTVKKDVAKLLYDWKKLGLIV